MTVSDPLSSTKEDAKKKKTIVATSTREGSKQSSKNDVVVEEEAAKGIHVPDQMQGPKRGRSRSPRPPPMQLQNRIFNASDHEVPSGPNPISNR